MERLVKVDPALEDLEELDDLEEEDGGLESVEDDHGGLESIEDDHGGLEDIDVEDGAGLSAGGDPAARRGRDARAAPGLKCAGADGDDACPVCTSAAWNCHCNSSGRPAAHTVPCAPSCRAPARYCGICFAREGDPKSWICPLCQSAFTIADRCSGCGFHRNGRPEEHAWAQESELLTMSYRRRKQEKRAKGRKRRRRGW